MGERTATRALGLTESEAVELLRSEGYNELPQPDRRTALRIVLEVLREPMLALLVGSALIYLVLGEPKDSIILFAFAMLSVVITVVQETRTERVLEALRDLTSPRALVVRGGERRRIAGREVVRGDVVILSEGDRVPADAILLECQDIQTDESLLTGESVPVRKAANGQEMVGEVPRPGGDDLPFVFSGSLVVRGTGWGKVVATGARSEIGKIGLSLNTLQNEPPRLRAQTQRLVLLFGIIGGVTSILAVVLYGLFRGGWFDALLAGIALGMSMLPEEFPVVLTVFMAMGAWRISQARVLTRRAAAIETLGSATVLCTDKTGTLTQNRMSVAELGLPSGEAFDVRTEQLLPAKFAEVAGVGLLASAIDPFDPMERALHELGARVERSDRGARSLVHTYGLRPDLLAVTHCWRIEGVDDALIATKGAPEAIASLCRLSPAETARVMEAVGTMAERGLRVLGVAEASHHGDTWLQSPRDYRFSLVGLVGFADPLRAGVPKAISQCRSAGIRVVMITGDYPATARAIAQSAGLDATEILSGDELAGIDDTALASRVQTVTVFARILPEQKLRIVTALKAAGEIVAMTGDGVNDAPSLKAAHIGVAMGGRGTDVAREASSIVLLDDDFGSIVKAVQLGRRIYDNLRKAMGFIFAVHVPIAGLALLPLVFGLPTLLWPVHIAFLEMVIDPVCSLVFESETEERSIMERPPRPPDQPLFSWPLIVWSVLQGALALGLVAAVFIGAHARGMPDDEVRALSFFSLVLSIVSLIFVNRSFDSSIVQAFVRPNQALLWVLLTVIVVLTLSLLWPFASTLFGFGPLHIDDLAVTLGAAGIVLVVLELLKMPLGKRLQG